MPRYWLHVGSMLVAVSGVSRRRVCLCGVTMVVQVELDGGRGVKADKNDVGEYVEEGLRHGG